MPFGYGTRTQQYIDASDAGPNDRIKVTFENGLIITFYLKELRRRTTTTDLFVDKERTDNELLELCYRHAVSVAVQSAKWRERKKYTLEAARTQVEIRLSVVSNKESFDRSPRVSEQLSLCSLFPSTSGSWICLPSFVKTVEFITV